MRRIASSIGVARPADHDKFGYLSEHHAYGMTEIESGDYAEDLAATIYSALGINPHLQLPDAQGRPVSIVDGGRVLEELFI